MTLYNLTIYEIKEKLYKKEVQAVEVLEDTFKRIDQVESKVGSYITLTMEEAMKKAREVDRRIAKNMRIGTLAGIPMSIKDNILTKGILTTCGSKMLEEFVPPYNATIYKMLKQEDAIMVGKTNMDEFAMGSTTESSFYKITRNPWNLNKVPGGSSGGAASALAAGEACFSIGSDTGGSIRKPASFCGLVGLKPTYGLVSRYGMIPMANSLDQAGPITRDVRDCALVLNAIAGHDKMDPTTVKIGPVDYTKDLEKDIRGLRIAIPKEYFDENLSEGVRKSLNEAIQLLKSLGLVCQEVSMPYSKYTKAVYNIIMTQEASLNLARLDGTRFGHRTANYENIDDLYIKSRTEGFGEEVKRRIIMGTYFLSTTNSKNYYQRALKVNSLIKEELNSIFSKYDAIITPTTLRTAGDLGKRPEVERSDGKVHSYTVAANLTGIPAISIPCGFYQGMPIGMQLMGAKFSEALLLRISRAFEKNTDFNKIAKL